MADQEIGSEPQKERGFFENLFDVYLAPTEAFGHILKRPRFWLPLVGFIAVNLAFTGVWMQYVDAKGFMEAQIEESGRADQIPPDQREQIIEQQAKFLPIMAWVSPLVFIPLFVAASAGFFLFVYRFFYAGELKFGHSLSIVSWSFLAVSLLSSPLILLVLHLKDDWTLNPQNALQANLSVLLDRSEVAPALWSLAQSIDLISFWTIFLLATGYAVSVRKPLGTALWGVVLPWAVYVMVKVGWASLMG